MIGYYLLALAGSMCTAIGGICAKEHGKKTVGIKNSVVSFNFTVALIFLAAYAVTGLVSDGGGLAFRSDLIPYSLLYGIAYVIGSYGYLAALKAGASLLVAIVVSQLGSLIPIVYGIVVLKEKPTVGTIAGLLLIFIALFLFYYPKKSASDPRPASKKSGFFVFLSFLGNGSVQLAIKLQQSAFPDQYRGNFLFWSSVIVAAVFLVMLLIRPPEPIRTPENKAPTKETSLRLCLTGGGFAALYALTNAASNYLTTVTVAHLSTVVCFMAGTGLGILWSFLVARFLYREKPLPLQSVGCAVSVAGLFFLTVGI